MAMSSTAEDGPPPADDTVATARYLEDLAIRLMLAHNKLDDPQSKDLIRLHMDPHFQMVDDSPHNCPFPPSNNLDTHLHNVAQHYKTHPDFEIRIHNVTAQVDEDGRHAIVWLTEAGAGSLDNKMFNRESVSRLYFRWRKRDRKWSWYKHNCVRGSGNFF